MNNQHQLPQQQQQLNNYNGVSGTSVAVADRGGGVGMSSSAQQQQPSQPLLGIPMQQPQRQRHSADPMEELQRVTCALSAMFASTNPDTISTAMNPTSITREDADKYLTSFQRQPVAWIVCDRILQEGQQPLPQHQQQQQLQFFAAQTLHAKCRAEIHQLPTSSLPSLRDSLVQHLITYYSVGGISNRALVTRLALAVCALAAQMCWVAVVDDMLDQKSLVRQGQREEHEEEEGGHKQQQDQRYVMVLLELFHLLPEEAFSHRLFVSDENLIWGYKMALQDRCAPRVLAFYLDTLSRLNKEEQVQHQRSSGALMQKQQQQLIQQERKSRRQQREKILLGLQTWLRFVDIPAEIILHYYDLVKFTFWIVENIEHGDKDEELFEPAVDMIVELLRVYPTLDDDYSISINTTATNNNNNNNTNNANGESIIKRSYNRILVERIVPQVMSLRTNGKFQHALTTNDEDTLRGYARIFAEMGESYMSLILGHENLNQVTLVELVLTCSAIPNNEIAVITLNFWYRFVHSLESLQPHTYRQDRIDHFQPLLLRLLQICVTLMQHPSDFEDMLVDQREDVDRNRYYVSDTVEDCCRLLGGSEVLRTLGERLQQECQKFATEMRKRKNPVDLYQGMEASLFAIRSISRFIPNDESVVLHFVFGQVIPSVPDNLPRLRYTVSLCIGSYSDWLGKHPDQLQPLLPFLAQGFAFPQCASASAIAIRNLCEQCTHPPMAEPALQLYEQFSLTNALELKDELEILEGVCKALSRQMGNDGDIDAPQMLGRVVFPIGTRLSTIMRDESQQGEHLASTKHIIAEMERLTVIVRFLRSSTEGQVSDGAVPQSEKYVVDLMSQSFGILETLTSRHPNDINLAEKVCRLHKHAMRSCGPRAYASLLDPLIAQLVRSFRLSGLSPYLYAASICITEFGRDPAYSPRLFAMISELSVIVFDRLRSFDDFTNFPDVVEEYFYLVGRFMSYCPEPLVVSPLFRSVLQCAGVGMHIQHREANKGTLNFLENTVTFGLNLSQASSAEVKLCKAALEAAILSDGRVVVDNLARSLLGDLPAYCLDHGSGSIAGLLWKLNSLCPELLHGWIGNALAQAPEPARSDFLRIFNHQVDQDEFFASVRSFKDKCERNRRIQGTA